MAKHTHTVLDEAPQHPVFGEVMPEAGSEVELDLSVEQRNAMVAAGWISEPIDKDEPKGSKKKEG